MLSWLAHPNVVSALSFIIFALVGTAYYIFNNSSLLCNFLPFHSDFIRYLVRYTILLFIALYFLFPCALAIFGTYVFWWYVDEKVGEGTKKLDFGGWEMCRMGGIRGRPACIDMVYLNESIILLASAYFCSF